MLLSSKHDRQRPRRPASAQRREVAPRPKSAASRNSAHAIATYVSASGDAHIPRSVSGKVPTRKHRTERRDAAAAESVEEFETRSRTKSTSVSFADDAQKLDSNAQRNDEPPAKLTTSANERMRLVSSEPLIERDEGAIDTEAEPQSTRVVEVPDTTSTSTESTTVRKTVHVTDDNGNNDDDDEEGNDSSDSEDAAPQKTNRPMSDSVTEATVLTASSDEALF